MQAAVSRKQRRQQREREEIMEVAFELFSKKGFRAVTMQEIARQSEFSVGKLYSFFKNKEALYKAIVMEKVHYLHRQVIAVLEKDGDIIATIRKAIRTKFQILLANRQGLRIFINESQRAVLGLQAGLQKPLKRLHQDALSRLERLFAEGIAKGLFRPADPRLYTVALDGMVNGLLVEQAEKPQQPPFDIDLMLDIFLRGIALEKGDSHAKS